MKLRIVLLAIVSLLVVSCGPNTSGGSTVTRSQKVLNDKLCYFNVSFLDKVAYAYRKRGKRYSREFLQRQAHRWSSNRKAYFSRFYNDAFDTIYSGRASSVYFGARHYNKCIGNLNSEPPYSERSLAVCFLYADIIYSIASDRDKGKSPVEVKDRMRPLFSKLRSTSRVFAGLDRTVDSVYENNKSGLLLAYVHFSRCKN